LSKRRKRPYFTKDAKALLIALYCESGANPKTKVNADGIFVKFSSSLKESDSHPYDLIKHKMSDLSDLGLAKVQKFSDTSFWITERGIMRARRLLGSLGTIRASDWRNIQKALCYNGRR
jgi:hypothetical protein